MFENVNKRMACAGVVSRARRIACAMNSTPSTDGGDHVDRADGVGDQRQRERDRDHDERVDDDLADRGGDALRHRQHRDARPPCSRRSS